MPFSFQDPFNFNVEISVSWCGCRYHDPAGFMPRVKRNLSGSPARFSLIERRSHRNSLGRLDGKAPAHNTWMLTVALHARAALHPMCAMPLNCVTGLKANENGRLVTGVTLVTPVTPVFEGGCVCALTLPFQIGPTPHCWPLVNQDDRRDF